MWSLVEPLKANPAPGCPVPMCDTPFKLILEELAESAFPLLAHPGWMRDFPWLLQGTTASGTPRQGGGPEPFDFRLFQAGPEEEVPRMVPGASERWEKLARAFDMRRIVHSRQLHGCEVSSHDPKAGEKPPLREHYSSRGSLTVVEDGDGHVTASPGILLSVTVADCVPISLVDPRTRSLGLLHGGWRGVARGILEAGVTLLTRRYGSRPQELHLHMGPSICGACYEVGPEVHSALGLRVPQHPAPVNLKTLLGERAVAVGVPISQITLSAFCTRCGGSPLFSHRGGDGERQLGLLGVRGK